MKILIQPKACINSSWCCVVAILALSCVSAHASLDGDEIRIEYHYPLFGEVFRSETLTVTSGLEVTCSAIGVGSGEMCEVNYGSDFTNFIDVSGDTIAVSWNNRGAFLVGDFYNGFVFADLDTGGAITGVSYQCINNDGQACIVETVFGNSDPELGSYVGVNFSDCTPPGDFNSCNPKSLTLTIESSIDNDQDGVENLNDNCVNVANASQLDSDSDGYGNACDGDFNNDCTVNFLDISSFSAEFLGSNLLFDLNGDGAVNFLDYSLLAGNFLEPPGPGLGSGICEMQ